MTPAPATTPTNIMIPMWPSPGTRAAGAGNDSTKKPERISHAAHSRCQGSLGKGFSETRKQWLAGVLEVRGELTLDDGAVSALKTGNSLLPVGVLAVAGNFSRGDVVTLVDSAGIELGRGLAEYSNAEVERLTGCHSDQIEERLGYRGR